MIAILGVVERQIFSVVDYVVHKLGFPESWSDRYLDVALSLLVTAILTLMSIVIWRRIRRTEEGLLPDGRITVTNIVETIVEAILKLMGNMVGHENARKHIRLIAPLFIYILISNLLGVIPGFYSPTQNINTNLACALVVFFYYNYCGIREQGFIKYFKHMAGPIIWLAPLMLAIEVVSHLVRPVSLSVRLLGNIAGDHMVLDIFSGLVPLFLPVVFMGLAIFIAILQAFVFALLSIIYIQMASAAD